jgi:hypothetical protein
VKKAINTLFRSSIVEEKSYASYYDGAHAV